MSQRLFYGWVLLGVLWLVFAFNLGFPAYGGPVLNTAMAKELGFSRETLGTITLIYIIMSGLPGPVVAMAVNRFGVRRTLVVGSVMNVAGATFMATVANSGAAAYLGFGLLVGGGVCAGAAIASQTALSRWFLRHRALALSILYSAGAIGGYFAVKFILPWAMEAGGSWRAGWWVIVALSALAAVLAMLLVRERPQDLGLEPDGVGAAGAGAARPRPAYITSTPWEFRDVVRRPTYWLIVASLVGGSGGYTLFLAHGIVHLQDLGHPVDVARGALATMTWTGLLAKAVIMLFGDRVDPRWLWGVFMLFFGAGLVIIVDARSTLAVDAFATCLGIGFGGGVVCLMAVLGNYFGLKAFALLSGIAIAINTTLSALAPYVAGFLFDHGYGYGGTCYFLAGWCFLGALVLFAIRKPVAPQPVAPAVTA
ncbi:MAG TPA: MFS transporter [Steroidobacteraceae bacterium]|nr:MFS transporter [Steroidobacteraceae bacterium]